MLKARQTLRVAGIAVILSYARIYKRATIVVKRIFVVSDVRFNDVMRIPRGQPHATLFTRPFLAFCVGRGWLARLGSVCKRQFLILDLKSVAEQSVQFSRYLCLCHVLRICNIRAIPTYRVYRLYDYKFTMK